MFDSHCHILDAEFASDRETVLMSAKKQSVTSILALSHSIKQLRTDISLVRDIQTTYPEIELLYGLGLHPDNVHPNNPRLEALEQPRSVADMLDTVSGLLQEHGSHIDCLGEVGLDTYWHQESLDQGLELVGGQVLLAKKYDLPLSIHIRGEDQKTTDSLHERMAMILKESGYERPYILHCFTGSPHIAQLVLKNPHAYISYSGVITYPSANILRESLKLTPLNRLFLETDSPYLTPVPHRGERNEPAYIAHTYAFVAQELGIPLADLDQATLANKSAVFSKPARDRSKS